MEAPTAPTVVALDGKSSETKMPEIARRNSTRFGGGRAAKVSRCATALTVGRYGPACAMGKRDSVYNATGKAALCSSTGMSQKCFLDCSVEITVSRIHGAVLQRAGRRVRNPLKIWETVAQSGVMFPPWCFMEKLVGRLSVDQGVLPTSCPVVNAVTGGSRQQLSSGSLWTLCWIRRRSDSWLLRKSLKEREKSSSVSMDETFLNAVLEMNAMSADDIGCFNTTVANDRFSWEPVKRRACLFRIGRSGECQVSGHEIRTTNYRRGGGVVD